MSPIPIMKAMARLQPGQALDVGARDCRMARRFAEFGYTVDAIDPLPPPTCGPMRGITYHQTTLESFETATRYDLVVASLVSQLVRYSVPDFLARLKSLAKENGLIYVTLIGDGDDWAALPVTKALTFEAACAIIAQLELQPLYRSAEWFEGRVYSGDRKFWHLHRFMLSRMAHS